MFYLILATVFGLVIIGSIVAAFATRNKGAFGVAAIAGVLFALTTLFFSLTTVDARSVGIQTAFGRYRDTLSPGLQLIAPWSSVEEFTTRLQEADLNSKDAEGKNAVRVSFSAPPAVDENGVPIKDQQSVAGGGNGEISAVAYYMIDPSKGEDGAKAMWEKYRTFEEVVNKLVIPKSQEVVSDVANDYTAGVASVNQTLIGDEVEKRLGKELERYGIVVDSVSIKGVDLDDATKNSLQRIVDNINKTQAAIEEQKRAAIDNQTAKDRAESGVLDAKNSQRYCLDIVNQWDAAKNGPLPATFNCGLGNAEANVLVQTK